MSLRSALIHILVAALAISPVMAHPQQADPDKWRAFAAQLPPNALVTVHLTSGERVEGHVVQVTTDALQVNPKTRNAVPVEIIAFDTIQSIDRDQKGQSTIKKELIWTAVVIGASVVIGFWIAAASGR